MAKPTSDHLGIECHLLGITNDWEELETAPKFFIITNVYQVQVLYEDVDWVISPELDEPMVVLTRIKTNFDEARVEIRGRKEQLMDLIGQLDFAVVFSKNEKVEEEKPSKRSLLNRLTFGFLGWR